MRTQENHQADGVSSQQILRLFSCLNPLVWSEECAVSNLCSSLSQRCFDNHLLPWSQLCLRGRGWGCRGVCRRAGAEGSSWQDQGLAPQGTAAFLAGQAQSHRARVSCGGPCPWSLNDPSFTLLAAMRNLSGNPGKGWEGLRYPVRAADTSIVEEKDPFPHQKVSSF